MQTYRLYRQADDGHVVGPVVFECDDDEEAVEIAAEMADGRPMELWERDRWVVVFTKSSQWDVRLAGRRVEALGPIAHHRS
jgi:hypothetical protein